MAPDSGYFVGNVRDPLRSRAECDKKVETCFYAWSVEIGADLWRAKQFVNPRCAHALRQKQIDVRHCLFGSVAALWTESNLFLMQFGIDAVEVLMDGIDMATPTGYALLLELLTIRRASALHTASFQPTCYGHVMSFDDWYLVNFKVNNVSLGAALADWWHNNSTASHVDRCSSLNCRQCPPWPLKH